MSVVRLLHQNDIWNILNSRKTKIRNLTDDSEENKLWLQSIVQGKINLDRLKKDMHSQTGV
jgi:hypothetical protein